MVFRWTPKTLSNANKEFKAMPEDQMSVDNKKIE